MSQIREETAKNSGETVLFLSFYFFIYDMFLFQVFTSAKPVSYKLAIFAAHLCL